VYLTKSKFLDLPHPKQIQLLILIHIHDKFWLFIHLPLLAFKKTSNNLSTSIHQFELL
jgi:hypothetical protein